MLRQQVPACFGFIIVTDACTHTRHVFVHRQSYDPIKVGNKDIRFLGFYHIHYYTLHVNKLRSLKT